MFDNDKINSVIIFYNTVSKYLDGKFFNVDTEKIGFIGENIENNKNNLADKEILRHILLTSLFCSVDKIANTVGYFEAYLRKKS
jgi:adenine-specific DNA-methyltransferase